MALQRVGWENGTLVEPAKVLSDNTVQPAQYEGTTPLSAANLKKMEDNTEDFVNEQVGDLNSLNTTDKSSAVGAINEVIGRGLKKLWENSNTNADFASQNITLSSGDYDYLIWFYDYHKNPNITSVVSMISLKSLGGVLLTMACASVGAGGNYYTTTIKRDVIKNSDTVYNISNCERSVGTSTPQQNQNSYCIPIVVYGGKF